jgi:transcriptional regulator with GAF, ATPase, and Fis domain
MSCATCGATAPDGASYCPRCGASLTGADPRAILLEATRLVADAGPDLDSTLDTLCEQAKRLLGADAAALQLVVHEDRDGVELEVRRPSSLADPGSPFATPGTRYRPGGFTGSAVEQRRPLFTADYHHDPRQQNTYRQTFKPVVASMVVPLFAADHLVGTLYLDWTRPVTIGPVEIEMAAMLGQHAAIAIRTARLLEEARDARVEMERLLEVVSEQARLDGAIKTARRIMHELNNQLSVVVGYGELLARPDDGGPHPRWLVEKMYLGASEAAATVAQLGRIIRFEESEFGGQVMLDLAAATEPTPPPDEQPST